MNILPRGYVRRPNGTYAKTVEFVCLRFGKPDLISRETLVRSARTGRLLRVERPRQVAPAPAPSPLPSTHHKS